MLPGSPAEFIVNTSNAGAGALSVTIDGPSKVKMDCQECPEGYRVTYTPMAPGSYLISIKYGGPYHIGGSPFKAKVTGKSQAKLLVPIQFLDSPVISQSHPFCPAGPRLVSNHSLHETSSVFVDSLTKVATVPQLAASGPSPADVSKVVAKGLGLNKAYAGQKSSFTVDCSKAGKQPCF